MNIRDIQQLLAKAGHYTGAIDGDAGPLTLRAVDNVAAQGGHNWRGWSPSRRLIAAGQAVLDALGHPPGAIDGWAGHNTAEALTVWQTDMAGLSAAVDRAPVPGIVASHPQSAWPQQRDMAAFYGPAGGPEATAGIVTLPFPFVLAWNPVQSIATFCCHRRLAAPMTAIFAETARHYGQSEMIRLRLHLFGGCFNYRPMRGGTALSTHAWGAAIDIDPERNQLRWGRDRAALARSEYDAFWRIVAGHGATSLGQAANRDWMHIQFARL